MIISTIVSPLFYKINFKREDSHFLIINHLRSIVLGVYELPRPREGPRAVDAFMIPLLDEEVAYEVLRYVKNKNEK